MLIQGSTTRQMAVYRPARREPPKCANAALQSLARRTTLPCGPHLALVHLGGSEICIIKVERGTSTPSRCTNEGYRYVCEVQSRQ